MKTPRPINTKNYISGHKLLNAFIYINTSKSISNKKYLKKWIFEQLGDLSRRNYLLKRGT